MKKTILQLWQGKLMWQENYELKKEIKIRQSVKDGENIIAIFKIKNKTK